MTPNPIPLFEVQIKVYLKPEHPEFGRFQSGLFYLWLYAVDKKQAEDTAKAIAAPLPFEIVRMKLFPIEGQNNLHAFEVDCAVMATQIGVNVGFKGYETLADEINHLGQGWPDIVPQRTP